MSGRIVRIAIIGAGPAGGASAIHLARLGYRVTLVERKAFPRAKVCGEYISPAATEALERVVSAERLRSLGATRAGSFSLRVDDRERTWATPSEAWALSRGTLDAELAQSAQNLGVDLRLESPVRSVAYAPLGARLVLDTGTLEADLVIHADGLGRHDLAEPTRAAPGMLGHKCHALIPGGEVGVGMRAARGAYVGTVTVEGGLSTIALCAREHLIRDHRGDADAMLGALWPAYRPAWRRGPWLACPVARSRYTEPGHARSVRLGNAAGAVDPVGGEGIGLALWSAATFADLLGAGADAEGLRRAKRELTRAYRRRLRTRRHACRLGAELLIRPALVRLAWPLLALPAVTIAPWYRLTGKPG
ncbi:MAG: FAD-dependent monooxygenase [Planctomycetota bacterium]